MHTPLTPTTRHRTGNEELTLAKPGIRLVNCARGGIYDERAVTQALGHGRVAGAAATQDTSARSPCVQEQGAAQGRPPESLSFEPESPRTRN